MYKKKIHYRIGHHNEAYIRTHIHVYETQENSNEMAKKKADRQLDESTI